MIIGPNGNRVAAALALLTSLAASEAAMTSRTHPSSTGKATLHGCSGEVGGAAIRTFQSLSYSSRRRNQMPVSLRPFGARSSHWYMPQSASIPRA